MELPSFLRKLLYGDQPPLKMIEITCAADYQNIPTGLFRVFRKHGHESLGLRINDTLCWEVAPWPTYFVDGKSVSWPEYKDKLPCVQLNFPPAPQKGVQRLTNGARLIEVGDPGGNLPGQSADAVEWDDSTSGVSGKEYVRRADIMNGLF